LITDISKRSCCQGSCKASGSDKQRYHRVFYKKHQPKPYFSAKALMLAKPAFKMPVTAALAVSSFISTGGLLLV